MNGGLCMEALPSTLWLARRVGMNGGFYGGTAFHALASTESRDEWRTLNGGTAFHALASTESRDEWRTLYGGTAFHALASTESRDEWRTLNGGTRGFENAVRAFQNAVRRILENADGRAFDRVGMNACGGSMALPEKIDLRRSCSGTATINSPRRLSNEQRQNRRLKWI